MPTGARDALRLLKQLRVGETKLLHSSWRFLVYRCQHPDYGDVVVKICLDYLEDAHKDGFRREILLTEHLQEKPPRTLPLVCRGELRQEPLFMVTEYVKHTPWCPGTDWAVGLEALRLLWSYPPDDLPENDMFRWDVASSAWYAHRICSSLQLLGTAVPPRTRDRIWNAFASNADLLERHCTFFCHGDFASAQVLVTQNGPLLFDWEHANQNTCALDPAHLYVNCWIQSAKLAEEWRSRVQEAAPSGEPFEELFFVAVIERALGKMNAARHDPITVMRLSKLLDSRLDTGWAD